MFKKILKKSLDEITIQDLLVMTQNEVRSYLLDNIPGAQKVAGNILLRPLTPEGVEYRPCLIAHMDTVSSIPPRKRDILEKKGTLSLSKWAQAGCLGGDDRCGVFIMIQIYLSEHRDQYTYLFCENEERGCKGSTAFARTEDFDALDDKTSVYIGIDRKCAPGRPEFALYDYDNEEILGYLEEALPLFTPKMGTFTDCSNLSGYSPTWVPCFNLTAGYEGEHTRFEEIHLASMWHTVDALMKLEIPDKKYEYEDSYSTGWGSAAESSYALLCDECEAHEPLYEDPITYGAVCEDCLSVPIVAKKKERKVILADEWEEWDYTKGVEKIDMSLYTKEDQEAMTNFENEEVNYGYGTY